MGSFNFLLDLFFRIRLKAPVSNVLGDMWPIINLSVLNTYLVIPNNCPAHYITHNGESSENLYQHIHIVHAISLNVLDVSVDLQTGRTQLH